MNSSSKDYEELELITVKLPRKDYEILKKVIEREIAYDWFVGSMKSLWVWGVAGGLLTIFMLYKEIIGIFK